MKHKHHDLIIAWANGSKIEVKSNISPAWRIENYPSWYEDDEYRIHYEPKIEVKYFKFDMNYTQISYTEFIPDLEEWALKITYKDDKIIKVEF